MTIIMVLFSGILWYYSETTVLDCNVCKSKAQSWLLS